jgi:hypothetical protein
VPLVFQALPRYRAGMTEPAATPEIQVPPLPPERLAEIRELLAKVERGDYSDTLPWDQVADELGL